MSMTFTTCNNNTSPLAFATHVVVAIVPLTIVPLKMRKDQQKLTLKHQIAYKTSSTIEHTIPTPSYKSILQLFQCQLQNKYNVALSTRLHRLCFKLQTTRIQVQKHTKDKLVSLVCFGISKHKEQDSKSHTTGINPLKHKKTKTLFTNSKL